MELALPPPGSGSGEATEREIACDAIPIVERNRKVTQTRNTTYTNSTHEHASTDPLYTHVRPVWAAIGRPRTAAYLLRKSGPGDRGMFGIGAGLSEVDPQSGGRARDRDARRMRTVASRECSVQRARSGCAARCAQVTGPRTYRSTVGPYIACGRE